MKHGIKLLTIPTTEQLGNLFTKGYLFQGLSISVDGIVFSDPSNLEREC